MCIKKGSVRSRNVIPNLLDFSLQSKLIQAWFLNLALFRY